MEQRLIDADALISDLQYDVDLDERALDCTDIVEPTRSTIQFDKDCKSNAIVLLKNMPTVEAIPIEWIEQYGKENWYDFGTQYNAITEMLKAWREKNGTD